MTIQQEAYWKRDGSISSAACADRRGLSVDRAGDRTDEEAVKQMRSRFQGRIVSLLVGECHAAGAVVRYLPSAGNPYHSEIHGGEDSVPLSRSQRHALAQKAKVEYMEA